MEVGVVCTQILEEHIEWNGAPRRRTLQYFGILTEHHLMLECGLHVKLVTL
jgi:hypothetical protein